MSYFSRPHPTTTETLLGICLTAAIALGAVYLAAWMLGAV